jgi:tetratricopeptide (TPR) repeat protein
MLNKIKEYFQKMKDKKSFKSGIKKLDAGYYKEAAEILLPLADSSHLNQEILYFNLAGALIGQDKLDEGEKYLNKAIAVDSKQDYLWATLAEVNILQKKWESAEKAIQKALELEPEKTIYESKKEVICGSQELKENYLKYFKLLKESIEEQKEENWKKAVELLVKAVEHYDQTGYVYNQIGAIYNNNLGNKERAAQFFKKAIEREPENEVFKRNLKQVLR